MCWFYPTQGRLLAVALIFFVILFSSTAYNRVASDAQPIAQVGRTTITAQELIYRQSIASAYSAEMATAASLVASINDALTTEVAGDVGVHISEAELESFAQYAKKNSKAPKLLATIEQLFGSDRAAFYRIFLAPKIINRKLRYWFSRNDTMHQQQRSSMQQAWAQVHAGQGFEMVAKATGLHYSTQDYGQKKAAAPDVLKQYFPAGMVSMSEGLKKLLTDTKPGSIVASISEDDQGYHIVRLLSKKGDSYNTEDISLTKASFDQWYKHQSNEISVQILDAALKQSIQSQYNGLAWVK